MQHGQNTKYYLVAEVISLHSKLQNNSQAVSRRASCANRERDFPSGRRSTQSLVLDFISLDDHAIFDASRAIFSSHTCWCYDELRTEHHTSRIHELQSLKYFKIIQITKSRMGPWDLGPEMFQSLESSMSHQASTSRNPPPGTGAQGPSPLHRFQVLAPTAPTAASLR